MPVNIAQMKKDEIIWLYHHRCQHGNRYIEHLHCYAREHSDNSKIGFIDIESSGLKADFAIVICYCILDLHTNEMLSRIITKKELFDDGHDPDHALLKQCVKDMRKFDRLIGYYSGDYRFDIPFLRARAISQNITFPEYGSIYFEDVYSVMKSKIAISSRRLENSSRFLMGESSKTHWAAKHWIRSLQGKQDSLDYILDHCKRDVHDLKKLYLKLYPFTKHTNRSI